MNQFQLVPTTYVLWMNKEKCRRSNHLIIHYCWKQIFCPNSSSFYGNFCNMTITEVYYTAQSHAMKKLVILHANNKGTDQTAQLYSVSAK